MDSDRAGSLTRCGAPVCGRLPLPSAITEKSLRSALWSPSLSLPLPALSHSPWSSPRSSISLSLPLSLCQTLWSFVRVGIALGLAGACKFVVPMPQSPWRLAGTHTHTHTHTHPRYSRHTTQEEKRESGERIPAAFGALTTRKLTYRCGALTEAAPAPPASAPLLHTHFAFVTVQDLKPDDPLSKGQLSKGQLDKGLLRLP